MKKLISMIVAFAMILTLGVPALAAEDTQTIYFENTNNWTTVYAYAWNDDSIDLLGAWPGTAMTKVEGEENIYSIEVPGDALYMIFNNGSVQTADQNIPTDGKNMYSFSSDSWSTYSFAGEPTVSGGTTGDVSATYTPTAKITGVSITVDGTTYTSGDVIITPESDVTLSVTGTNLQYGTEDNNVNYCTGIGVYLNSGYFTFNDDGTIATYNSNASDFSLCQNHEIRYSNSYGSDEKAWVYTGIYVTYDSGIAEEDKAVITGVSITVDGIEYTSGNVTVYSDSTVTLTVTGTNLQNGTNDNFLDFSNSAGSNVTSDFFIISDDGTTATYRYSDASNFSSCQNYEIRYSNSYGSDEIPWVYTGIYVTYNENAKPTYYDITVSTPENGTVTVDRAAAAEGETVTVTVTPDEGYTLNTLIVGGNDVTDNVQNGTYTFTMGNADVEISATFKKIDYTITVNSSDNGSVTAPATAAMGDVVRLTWTTDTAYELGNISVKDANGNDVSITDKGLTEWTFVMPASNVTITATFNMLPITSAEITWGSLSFTYSDEQVTLEDGTTADKGWSNDGSEGAGTVTVKNTGDNTFTAIAEYKQETDYTEINGYFAENSATASSEIASGTSYTFTLELNGKPKKAITAGTKIGSVTITINEAAEG